MQFEITFCRYIRKIRNTLFFKTIDEESCNIKFESEHVKPLFLLEECEEFPIQEFFFLNSISTIQHNWKNFLNMFKSPTHTKYTF